jgi:hypothetical protein
VARSWKPDSLPLGKILRLRFPPSRSSDHIKTLDKVFPTAVQSLTLLASRINHKDLDVIIGETRDAILPLLGEGKVLRELVYEAKRMVEKLFD